MTELTLDHILSHECPNLSPHEGFETYRIELHCMVIVIHARVIEPGKYDQEAGDWSSPPKYEIKEYTFEPN